MKEYIVSARKYRPMSFDSVVGQSALTTTLKNAVKSGKLAHAYLFCGPRGVGKTTCARIFAKAINCMSPTEDGEACNQCESCQAFNEQRSYNIFELDAASNNSVENIKALMEQTRIPPQVGKYKVFIIDEVHMLSTQAFNAFLKTLEEPPAHVVFILATTEKHKILPTIISRCQIYDFERMTVPNIVNHLKMVAEKEGIGYEEEALNVIAEKADGGMRDALSVFDQAASFCQGNITYNKVIEDLNVLDADNYFNIIDLSLDNKVADIMVLLNNIINKGFDGGHLISGLASHVRNVMMAKDEQTLPLLQVSQRQMEKYKEQASKCPPNFLYKALKVMNDCDINYRTAKNKRLTVELALIRMTQLGVQAAAPTTAAPIQNTQKTQNTQNTPNIQSAQSAPNPPSTPKMPTTPPLPKAPSLSAIPKIPNLNGVGTSPVAAPAVPTPQPTAPAAAPQNNPFTKDRFNDAWTGLKTYFGKEDSRLRNVVSFYQPVLHNQQSATLELPNQWELEEVKKALPRIHAYLHQQLKNDQLTLTLKVAQYTHEQKAFTAEERYKVMLEENTALNTLKEQFALQID